MRGAVWRFQVEKDGFRYIDSWILYRSDFSFDILNVITSRGFFFEFLASFALLFPARGGGRKRNRSGKGFKFRSIYF